MTSTTPTKTPTKTRRDPRDPRGTRPLRKPVEHRERTTPQPILRFTPRAWAKLVYLRDLGPTEIGGFGIADRDDPLRVTDFALVRQETSFAHVDFDDEAVADFFDARVDAGLQPSQFMRLWCHTHPGDCPQPSGTDEQTFERVFGVCDWAVMFILARGGQVYARLRFGVGPGGQMTLPVEVDYRQPFAGSDHRAWEDEYRACVRSTDRYVTLAGCGRWPWDRAELDCDDPIELQLADFDEMIDLADPDAMSTLEAAD